jgi:hypothetical protein
LSEVLGALIRRSEDRGRAVFAQYRSGHGPSLPAGPRQVSVRQPSGRRAANCCKAPLRPQPQTFFSVESRQNPSGD